MLLMKRIMAQVIDLIVGLLIIFGTFGFLVPFVGKFIGNDVVLAILGIVVIALVTYGVQFPFMTTGQTIGKAFFQLKVISTDKIRKNVPVAVMMQREILCKLMSCYFICLPMLAGKMGGHEEATHTKLVRA
ncbi:RDD family protein [Enterococcus timonensis]|uniref:RDD family protein n=1 Tax=Enterococcus timonensis TaxID=1852364 RepID=UPI0008DA94ED|nr:RDD family protein [Enterococcus timonensis]